MRSTTAVGGMVLAIVVAACTGGTAQGPGVVSPVTPEPIAPLWAPVDQNALEFTVPETVGGIRLREPAFSRSRQDARDFALDPAVWPVLIEHGLGDGAVRIAQRADDPDLRASEFPDVSIAAVWVDGLAAADHFTRLDPMFYLLATTVGPDNYRWDGAKPAPKIETLAGRDVYIANFDQGDVAWYTKGEVLFIIVAKNQQRLASALIAMPTTSEIPDLG